MINGPALSNKDNKANVIEEIPSHELYATLVGIPFSSYNNANNKDHSWSCSDSGVLSHSSQRNIGPILIPPPIMFQECKSEFGKAYNRAVLEEGFIKPSQLSLNSSNKGFKMLEKMGWKESGGGLGKQRQGILTPVNPCLKLDHKGLGCCTKNKKKMKVHRDGSIHDNVSRTPMQPCQKRRRRQEEEQEEEARTMKRIRLLLRSDLADEYLQYL